jgi:general secretion pathway protein L
MSLLVIQLPARQRLAARGSGTAPGIDGLPVDWAYAYSDDERSLSRSGRAAPALLPRASRVLAVVADSDLSWHQIDVPKAPPARLRAALGGAMEELLLDDDDQLHLALGAGAVPGQRAWVAVLHRPWLQAQLTALEAGGLSIERVLPASRPVAEGAPLQGHFCSDSGASAQPQLVLSRPDGVMVVRLAGALARALQPAAETPVQWTTTPAAAAAAEHWLGMPVPLLGEAERLLAAAQGDDNLRQFDLAARHRGSRALSYGLRRLLSPEWRPVRLGLATLVVVQLVGLNAYAWQEGRALAAQRAAMTQLLRDTHPGVRAVLDAPRQMQRETERLRAAAGRPGGADLEMLLAAAAAAWPDGQGPVQTLRFEPGRLVLAAPGWGEPALNQFRQRLQAAGFSAELADGRITLTRGAA